MMILFFFYFEISIGSGVDSRFLWQDVQLTMSIYAPSQSNLE